MHFDGHAPTASRRPTPARRAIGLAVALAASVAAHDASAIMNGADSPDTNEENSTVCVNGATRLQGSGTLIAPDLVVTNGHVAAVPLPPMSPPFASTDAHDPALWHPITGSSPVFVMVGPSCQGTITVGAQRGTRTRLTISQSGPVSNRARIDLTAQGYFASIDGSTLRMSSEKLAPNRSAPSGALFQIVKAAGTPGSDIYGNDRVTLTTADGRYLGVPAGASRVTVDSRERAPHHEFIVRLRDGSARPLGRGEPFELEIGSGGQFLQVPFRAEATRIATPGFDDVAILKLATPVPPDVARHARIKLRVDIREATSVRDFYARANMTVLGFGLVNGGARATTRQKGTVGAAAPADPPSRYNARSPGPATQLGDSGGSWFIDTPLGRRLVGITQQTSNTFISPMSRGGLDTNRRSKPDLHAWFSMILNDDDCVPAASERGLRRDVADKVGATSICRFGEQGSPYAVAYDAKRTFFGEACRSFDPKRLTMQRPSRPEGSGADQWVLAEGTASLLPIEGTWQQSYTRGIYLIDYLQRASVTKLCRTALGNPPLTYFRR